MTPACPTLTLTLTKIKAAEGQPLPASLRYRGECLVQTGHNRCVVSVFDYRVGPGETVQWQEEEVDWGSYLPWHEVNALPVYGLTGGRS